MHNIFCFYCIDSTPYVSEFDLLLKKFSYDFSEIDVAVLLHLTAEQHQQDMNEPANFQPDDPNKLEKMNCTGNLNNPPYMPRKHNCTTAAQLLHYPILILTNNFCCFAHNRNI